MDKEDKFQKLDQLHPEWAALDQSQKIDKLHRFYYPDLPKEQVARALGVALEAPKQPTAERKLFSLTQGSALNDYVTEGVNAAAGGISSAANFVVPGNRVSKAIDKFVEDSQGNFTESAQQGKRQLASDLEAADGIGGEAAAALKYVAQNPGLAISQAVGSFVGPGAAIKGSRMAARGVGLAEKAVTRAGLGAGAATGAAMAGGDAAATAYDLVIKAGGTPEEAEAAARQASVIPAAIGGLGGLVGAERVFAGAKGFTGGAASRALKTGAVEGLQEGIEEGVTQYEGQRAATPYDPTIDPMKGVGGAATLGAVLGAATGAGASVLHMPNNGPLSRGANLALDQAQKEAQALRPVAPGLTPGQEDQAMSSILAQGDADMQAIKQAGIRDNGPSLYPDAAQPIPGMAGQMDPLSQSAEPFESLGDRILTTRQTLDDEGNREAIRSKFGQSALNEVLYYLNQADRPGQIPDQTRENMLAVAEEIISRSRLSPVEPTPSVGAGGFSPMARLGADAGLPQIGLDTTPTGVMRADAKGNVAPETNADAISTRQAQAEREVLGEQARRASAVPADPAPKAPAPPPAIGYDTSPTGRMLSGADGVAVETQADRINRESARSVRPGDRLNPSGLPFKNKRAAMLEMRRAGGDVVEVRGGWVVRPTGEADDVRGSETFGAVERSGSGGSPDAVGSMGSDGRGPDDGGVAVDERGRATAGRDGVGVGRASAVPDRAVDRGIGEALNEQAQPATPAAPKTQAPQEAADPRGAGQASAGEQGGGVPRAGGRADAQADGVKKTPDFLKTKTVPEMTDEELKEAQAFYGPNHKRAKTIEKEMGKRAPKVPAVAEPKPSAQAPLDEGKARKDDQEPVKARQAGEVVGEATEVSEPEALPAPETNEGAQDGQQVQGQAPAEKLSLSPLEAMTGKRIDADWVAFSEASDTLGIPRAEMPQIKDEHRGAMVNFLNARGIEHEQDEVAAASLKPTQAEFSPAKVAQAKAYEGGDRSILVSEDGRVVDGHHQWLAKLDAGDPVKVIQLMAPVREVLDQIKEFPSADQDQASAQDAEQQDDAQASQPEPEAKATEPQETPQVSEAEARKRLTWRDLGQSGGEKTWGLYYDDGEGRGMRYGTVSKLAGSRWSVDGHDGGKYEGLQPAKNKAKDMAVERLRRDGYVTAAPVDGIGWDGMSEDQRTKILSAAGWTTAAGGLNFVGKRLLNTAWSDISEGTRGTIERFASAQEQDQQAATGGVAGATAGGSRSEPAVKQAKPSSRIEDVGEKIGGARKDVWTSFKDDLNAVADGDLTNQPLSKIWPAPDYQKLIDDGMDAGAVALVRSFRDEIPAKPRATWKVKRWAEQVKTLREFANDLLSGSSTADQFRQSARNLSAISNGLLGRADLYLEVGHGKSLEGIRLVEHHYTLYRGRENVKLWAVEREAAATAFSNWPQEIATGDTKQQAIDGFKAKYATLDAEKQVKKASFDVISMQGKFFVAKKVGRNYAKLAGPFATVKEARDHRLNNLADLEKALEAYKEIPKERRDVNAPRVGEDMRNGQDVTPDFFAKTFGFRGVEFGNWVEQSRRQKDLNDAFDALMDMAAVLGLPPKALSLNGELGLAFGARGGGGVGAAAAHYEHSKVVINLTKKEGAGSLGHEWWHAVDNYFSRMRKQPGDMMTTALDVSLASRGSNFVVRDGVRREMVQAFGQVVSAIKRTAMKARSERLDGKRSKEYWTTGEEMSARAFESYLIAKLQDQQASNDYLANVVDQRTWDAMAALGVENDNSYPYPTADEIPAIREGFDQFFQAVQTRENDAGNVVMFSRQGDADGQNTAEQNALKALSENDDLFRLPKSDGMTVEDITADNDPGIKVKKLQGIPGRTEYQFTMPNGKTARMVVRPANPYGANTYGFDYVDGEASNVLDVRPGDNPEDVDADKEDVWIDVSLLSSGQDGARIYNIASTYAHNTGRIFIGDPAGLSDDALIRRPEQMLSSALKFGTTEHLAPHPRQITGDDRLGVPSLQWVYGDHIGNIKRLIDVNLKVAENAGLDEITFDPTDGSFRDSEGGDLGREGIQALAMGAGYGRAAGAGPDTLARGAVLRALLREEGGAGEGEVGGRDGLLARLVSVSATHDEATKRVFYSREGVDQPETGEGFRRQDAIAAIAHMDMVEDLVRQLTDGWKNAPEIVVLRSMEEAPEAVRRENDRQLANGATGEPEAFYHQGKAYLLASHMRSMNDVRRAVFHEVLGHLGMRGLYGTEIGEILDQVARARRADVEAKAKQYGLNMKNARDRQIAAEEWLAEIAQDNPQLGFVRRAVAAIRSWLRRNVPALAKMRMTDDEIIRELIVPVQKFIKDGPPDGGMGLLPAFRRDRGFSRGEGQRVAVKRDESGERVYAAGGVSLVYPIESERLEVIPGPGQKVLNYVIMPTDSFDVLGNMEVLVENGEPVSILDINVDGRNKGVGAKAVGMLLAAHPTTDMNVSNIVPSAQGFWEKMGIPTQNREEGAAYDGTINHATYLDAQAGRGAQGVLAEDQGQNRQADARAEGGTPQALGGEEVGFSRTQAAQQFTGKAREAVFDVKGATGNTLADYRGMALQALGRRQLVDLYGDLLPQLKRYDELVQRMDAEKNDSAAEADALANEWGRLDEKPVLGPAKYPGMERKLAELMHDATLAQIDPDKPLQRGDNPAQHAALRARFDALSPNAQSVYRRARDMYEGHYAKVREAIQDRIMRSELGDSKKKAMIARMDADFFQKTKGVYFPLARFGKYVMVVKDADGNVVNVSRAETLNEAETTRNMLLREFDKAKGFVVTKVMKEAEFNRKQDIVGKGFVTDLFAVLDKQGVDDALRDSVSQLYLSSLPDLSWAKHGIHRKGTPGFSQDARRAFAQNVFHGARYLAKLRYSDQMQNELTAMGDHIKAQQDQDDYDGVKAQQVQDEMVKRHDNLMSPETNSVSTALTSLGYVWFMGLSPAAAMVNLSQTALMAYPVMGAKWGYGKAASALLLASKQTVQAKNDISKILTGDELAAYNRAVADGTIDVTMAHDLAGISQGEDAKVTWALRPVMKVASFMFHHAERFNRQATFIASYRLAKESGAGLEAAFEQAKKATYDGHFDYSASNRPRIMQGNVARVVFLFKQYGQNMIYTMSRQAYLATQSLDPKERAEARKQLGGMLVLHAAAAGALGLPLVGALLSAASFIGSDDDEPWDAEVALKNAMADSMGPKAAEVMAHGLSRLTPWDLSGRVALNKLILPDVQEGLEGQRWAEAMSSAMLGPVWGIVSGMAKGLQEMGEGRYQRGLENMLPVALRNPVKALRYQEEGAIDKTGVAIKDEVSAAGVIGQASGFSPSEVRAATEVKSAIFQHDRARMDRRSSLMAQFAQAQMAGDADALPEIRKAIAAFNAKNPERRITPRQLRQSVRNRERRIEESDKGIYLPKNRRDSIEAVRFGE